MDIRSARAADQAALRNLLVANRLPVEDLDESDIGFLVASDGERVLGVIGMERHGDTGLLRSLVVADEIRGTGMGARLVSSLEELAQAEGCQRLVLLTQTAAPFFASRGYEVIERDAAPADVRASAEFRSLCPASATCMAKMLGGT